MIVPDTTYVSTYFDIEMTLTDRELFIHSMLLPPEWKYYNVLVEFLQGCEADSKFSIVDKERERLRAKIVYNNASITNRFKGPFSFETEVLRSYARGFILKRHTSEQIWKRMQGLYSSGILGWHNLVWNRFHEDKGMLQDVPLISGFQASSLRGSIMVVFIIGIQFLVPEIMYVEHLTYFNDVPDEENYNFTLKILTHRMPL